MIAATIMYALRRAKNIATDLYFHLLALGLLPIEKMKHAAMAPAKKYFNFDEISRHSRQKGK